MTDEPEFPHDRQYRDTLFEQCVWCGEVFGAEEAEYDKTPSTSMEVNGTFGPVVGAKSGREFDVVCNSPGGTYLMHPDCYKEYDAEQKAEANHGLEDFA